MCDTGLLAGVSLGSSILGSVNSAAADYGSTYAAKNALKLQAATDENNAILAEFQAEDALARGKQARDQYRREINQIKGTARANRGASGVEVDSGSALSVFAGIDVIAAEDDYTIGRNAQREAAGYEMDAFNSRSNAALRRHAAASQDPGSAARSTLLAGAGQVAGKWYKFSEAGVFG